MRTRGRSHPAAQRRRRPPLGITAAVAVVAAVATGCGTGGGLTGPAAVEPREGRSGLHLSGTVDGRQVAVSDGLPRLEFDCDPGRPDEDVCVISRTLGGGLFVLVIENPDALVEGEALPVAAPDCPTPQACAEVSDVAVVDIQFDDGSRQRATGGQLSLSTLEEGRRYAGAIRLELADGRLSGTFDVVPRPDD